MREFLEEVFAVLLAMMLIVALTVSWVCVVVVGTEIFLPIAGLVTALAGVLVSGAFISARDNKKGKK